MDTRVVSETGARVDAIREWRSPLTAIACGSLLYLTISGLAIYVAPFGAFAQTSVLLHVVAGLASLVPLLVYLARHWWVRRRGKLSHFQLLGYLALVALMLCIASGLVTTWQGLVGPRMSAAWDLTHLLSGLAAAVFLVVHIAMLVGRTVKNTEALARLRAARGVFFRRSGWLAALPLALGAGWSALYQDPQLEDAFPADYAWRFGEDRPFAPSLARIDHGDWGASVQERVLADLEPAQRTAYLAAFREVEREPIGLFAQVRHGLDACGADDPARFDSILAGAAEAMKREGALNARALAGSAGCGTSGCHSEIYEEWLPSAHRFSSLDDMFQKVQELMAVETSPEHTRYCAGCHDPISLFSGAKNAGNVTLSAEGADEGTSCLVCHSIVQADVQGNGDYMVRAPERYLYELHEGGAAKFASDFLIRTYPKNHVHNYSRALYKTPEFCGACHKQYLDLEVNTDIGKVQGQNQYDSWKNSRWNHPGDPERTVTCRECHMPLVADSRDPAHGDPTDSNRTTRDGKHRGHRMLASNQYIPILQDLEGAEEHVALTEQWLRGEIEIPEIAHKWAEGPVVRMRLEHPEQVSPGDEVPVRIVLTNNKTGHDFPTGPLDMIESWVELIVTDESGTVVHHAGGLDEAGSVADSPFLYAATGFDRRGELIDRHNLWDLVGASYKRSVYPGVNDVADIAFQCPSMSRGRLAHDDGRSVPGQRTEEAAFAAPAATDGTLTITAVLWYRKANPEFLDRVYGAEARVRAPATEMTRSTATIRVAREVAAR